MTNAKDVSFISTVTADTFTQLDGSGTTTFGGKLDLDGAFGFTGKHLAFNGDGSRVGGSVSASSSNGNITQTGSLSVLGSTSLNVGTGDITLLDAGNDFVGVVSATGNVVQINDKNALTAVLNTTGDTTLSAGGSLTVSGSVTGVGSDLVTSTSTAGLGTIFGATTVGGNLSSTSANGDITQTGALTVTGTSTLNAGTGDITLTNAGNNFVGAVSSSGDEIALTDGTGGLVLGKTVARTLDVNSTGGAIKQQTAYTSGNAITVSGAASFTATSGTSPNVVAANITLANPDNDFGGTVDLSGAMVSIKDVDDLTLGIVTSTGNLFVTNSGALDLGTSTVGGILTAVSGNGDITQTGALTVTGTSTLNAGTGDITLLDAGNDFVGTVTATGDVVQINDKNALTLGTVSTTGDLTVTNHGALNLGTSSVGGNLVANSDAGNITQSGALSVTGTSDLTTTGDITLTNAGNNFVGAVSSSGDEIALTDGTGGLVLGKTVARTLDVNSTGGAIKQQTAYTSGNAITVSGAASFTATSGTSPNVVAANITLANPDNDFGGTVDLSGAMVSIKDVDDLTLGIVTSTGNLFVTNSGALDLGTSTVGGILTAVSGNGDITQTGALTVTGTSTLNAGTGDITLLDAGNDFVGTVTATGDVVQINDKNALTLGTVTTSGDLTVSSTGALNLGTSTVGGKLSGTSGNGDITQGGALTVTGTSTLNAGTGDITLMHAGNDFVGAVSSSGDEVKLKDVTGGLILGKTTATTLDVTSTGGDITQETPHSVNNPIQVTGLATFTATDGKTPETTYDIILDNPNNDFQGVVSAKGDDIRIADKNGVTLGTVDATGDIQIISDVLILSGGTIGGLNPIISAKDEIRITGDTTFDGHVVLSSNEINIEKALTAGASANLTLTAYTAGQGIRVGASGTNLDPTSDKLDITALELSRIGAGFGSVVIGNKTSTRSDVTVVVGAGNTATSLNALTLNGRDIVFESGTLATTAGTTLGMTLDAARDLRVLATGGETAAAIVAAGDLDIVYRASGFTSSADHLSFGRAVQAANITLTQVGAGDLTLGAKPVGTASLSVADLANLKATGTLTIDGSAANPATASSSPVLTVAGDIVAGTIGSNLRLDFNRIALDHDLILSAGKTLTLSAAANGSTAQIAQATTANLNAGSLLLTGAGAVNLAGLNKVSTLASDVANNVVIRVDQSDLTIGTVGSVSGITGATMIDVQGARTISVQDAVSATGNITLAGGSGLTAGQTSDGITIGSAATVVSTSGNVVLDAGMAGNFINARGTDAVKASNGTWQVWSAGWSLVAPGKLESQTFSEFNGLNSGNTAVWDQKWSQGRSLTGNDTGGNRYVFASTAPAMAATTVLLSTGSATKTYGDDLSDKNTKEAKDFEVELFKTAKTVSDGSNVVVFTLTDVTGTDVIGTAFQFVEPNLNNVAGSIAGLVSHFAGMETTSTGKLATANANRDAQGNLLSGATLYDVNLVNATVAGSNKTLTLNSDGVLISDPTSNTSIYYHVIDGVGYAFKADNSGKISVDPRTLTLTVKQHPSVTVHQGTVAEKTYNNVSLVKIYDKTSAATLSTAGSGLTTGSDFVLNTVGSDQFDISVTGKFVGKDADGKLFETNQVDQALYVVASVGKDAIKATGNTLASNYIISNVYDFGVTDANNKISAVIAPKRLTVTGLTSADKVYDGTVTAKVSGSAVFLAASAPGQGTVNDGKPFDGDELSLTGKPVGQFNSKDVLTANTVSFVGLTFAGKDSSNYVTDPVVQTGLKITPKTVSLSATKEYDGTTTLQNSDVTVSTGVYLLDTTTGQPTNVMETLSISNAVAASKHVAGPDGNVATLDNYISSITIADGVGTNAGLVSNYQLAVGADGKLSAAMSPVKITPKALSIDVTKVIASKVYDGTTDGPSNLTFDYSLSGYVTGDTGITVTYDKKKVQYNAKDVDYADTLTISGLAVDSTKPLVSTIGSLNSDYSLNLSDLDLKRGGGANKDFVVEIARKDITLSAEKVYDGTTSLAGKVTVHGLVAGETLNYSGALAKNANVAGPDGKVTSATVPEDNYISSITLLNGVGGLLSNYAQPEIDSAKVGFDASKVKVTITPAPLTVKAADDAKLKGQTVNVNGETYQYENQPNYGFAGVLFNGFVNGETQSVLGGALKIGLTYTDANDQTKGGVLTPTDLTADNYKISFVDGKFDVLGQGSLLVRSDVGASQKYGKSPELSAQSVAYLDKNGVIVNNLTTTSTNGLFNVTQAVGNNTSTIAEFAITAAAQQSDFSSTGRLGVGGYNLTAGNVNLGWDGSPITSVKVVGSLNVTPVMVTLDQETFDSVKTTKVYDGNTSVPKFDLNLPYGVPGALPDVVVNGQTIKDDLSISGVGTFDDRHVGTDKTVTLSFSLSGSDARHYALTAPELSNNKGVIDQLDSVQYKGPSDGLWSSSSNWDGALPDRITAVQADAKTRKALEERVVWGKTSKEDIASAIGGLLTLSRAANKQDIETFVSNDATLRLFAEEQQSLIVQSMLNLRPLRDNVGKVIIGEGSSVIYNVDQVGVVGSAIQNDGRLSINAKTDLTFANALSGSGILAQSGSGVLTVTGTNTNAGFTGSLDIGTGKVVIADALALGKDVKVLSNGGTLALGVDDVGKTPIKLGSLSVTGAITLSDLGTNTTGVVHTVGNQKYDGALTFLSSGTASSVSVNNGVTIVTPGTPNFMSDTGNIAFESTVSAGAGSKDAKRSLVVAADKGSVTINGQIGTNLVSNGDPEAYETIRWSNYAGNLGTNPWAVDVTAKTININANVTSFETQRYTGSTLIGSSKADDTIRLLVSLDPSITFVGSVNDSQAGKHTLVLRAISLPGTTDSPTIETGAIGDKAKLGGLDMRVGQQWTDPNLALVADLAPPNTGGDKLYSDEDRFDFVGKVKIEGPISTTGDLLIVGKDIQFVAKVDSDTQETIPITLRSDDGTVNVVKGLERTWELNDEGKLEPIVEDKLDTTNVLISLGENAKVGSEFATSTRDGNLRVVQDTPKPSEPPPPVPPTPVPPTPVPPTPVPPTPVPPTPVPPTPVPPTPVPPTPVPPTPVPPTPVPPTPVPPTPVPPTPVPPTPSAASQNNLAASPMGNYRAAVAMSTMEMSNFQKQTESEAADVEIGELTDVNCDPKQDENCRVK